MKGHFTKLWKARWISKGGKLDVAIKQLKHNDSHLLPFMTMSQYAMLWNDSTLIKIHGATLGLLVKLANFLGGVIKFIMSDVLARF